MQDGAANERYFRATYLNLHVVEKDSIAAQIEGIIDGSCDAIEVTSEDLYAWVASEYNPVRSCTPRITGRPIVRRNRGMMATLENHCVITAINAVYAKFATAPVDNAGALSNLYFDSTSQVDCKLPEWSEREARSMGIPDLAGAFIMLAGVIIYGMLTMLFGKGLGDEIEKKLTRKQQSGVVVPVGINEDANTNPKIRHCLTHVAVLASQPQHRSTLMSDSTNA